MSDPLVAPYLPSKLQCLNKLPERGFFFGILSTVRTEYMRDIIKEAHERRFKISDLDQSKKGILISDSWLQELKKHPYFSSKIMLLTY